MFSSVLALSFVNITGTQYPPMFIEEHGGMRCLEMKLNHGKLVVGREVFHGASEPGDRTWSAGPEMRCARVDLDRIRVYQDGHRTGRWRIPGGKILNWWRLPVVVQGVKVLELEPHGRFRKLPISSEGLITVLPGRSGDLFALYTTKSHWRILRRGKAGDHWTPWLPGAAQDFTSSSERLYVACGASAYGYKKYGAYGPGVLWTYDYRAGASKRLLELPLLAEEVFDDPWIHSGHLLSVMTWPPEPKKFTKHWYPFQTELYRMTDVCTRLEKIPSGWEIHGFDPIRRKIVGLHVNRSNMGFDFREVAVDGMAELKLDEDVDFVDISTGTGYSPVVDDRKAIPKSGNVRHAVSA